MKIKFLKPFRLYNPIGDDLMMNEGTVENMEKEDYAKWLIDNGFAEEVKESSWWKPENGGRYYYVNDDGEIIEKVWLPFGSPTDEKRFSIGNDFRNNLAAERYRDYLKAIATVRQDEGVLTPEQINELEGKQGKAYHVGYMGKQNGEEVRLIDLYETWAPVGVILFDTGEHAQASLDNHSDEWKIIANYDWSRE